MRTRLAWGLVGLTGALAVGATVLTILNGFDYATDWQTGAGAIIGGAVALLFALVGALVASRRERNAIGWICIAIGVGIVLNGLASQAALYALETDPGALPGGEVLGWLGSWDYNWFVALLAIYLPLLFPSGRLPGPRWRPVAWIAALATVVLSAGAALRPGPLAAFPEVRNPFETEGGEDLFAAMEGIGALLYAASMLAAVASLVLRYRHASGIERQQLKWFALAGAVIAVPFIPLSALSQGTPGARVAADLVSLAFAGLPAAAGIAILRYRLYDIDVVINRALVYTTLTVTLAAMYLVTVLLLQLVLPERSDLAIAGSTLAAAALVRPARSRIQELVDRRFFRSRYDAARTLAAFVARLRDEVTLDAVSTELRSAISETVQPAHVSLWMRP